MITGIKNRRLENMLPCQPNNSLCAKAQSKAVTHAVMTPPVKEIDIAFNKSSLNTFYFWFHLLTEHVS